MGASKRSIRSWLALTAAATAASSGLLIAGIVPAAATTSAVIAVLPGSGQSITEVTEGESGGGLVAKFTDSANAGPTTNCSYQFYAAVIHWGDGTTSAGTISCEKVGVPGALVPNGVFDVAGAHVYRDSGNYVISVTVSDTERGDTNGPVNTTSASISDVSLGYDEFRQGPLDGKAIEGASVTVGAAFFDDNAAYPQGEGSAFDPGISGTINWGDQSALQSVAGANPPTACVGCVGDTWISASHVYDANAGDASYTVTIKAIDDGGMTASTTIKVTVSDGGLTAGAARSFSATAAQATSPVLASFTDAANAQAAAADFTASVKWGDNTTSAGTVTKTAAGAFSVSGSHTYATAGNRTATVTITDEEGQSLTMTASAGVGAAPVVLPLTGQPKLPASPGSPVLPLLAIALGLLTMAAGARRFLFAKRAR